MNPLLTKPPCFQPVFFHLPSFGASITRGSPRTWCSQTHGRLPQPRPWRIWASETPPWGVSWTSVPKSDSLLGSFMLNNHIYVGCGPVTVTVTTRIITFLVGDPYKPSFTTVTVRGPHPIYMYIYDNYTNYKRKKLKADSFQVFSCNNTPSSWGLEHVPIGIFRHILRESWQGGCPNGVQTPKRVIFRFHAPILSFGDWIPRGT